MFWNSTSTWVPLPFIDQIYLYCSHRGPEIVIYFFTVESLKRSVFQATGDGAEPVKEEISGQSQLSHTNQMHTLRWRPTVGSFRCYFQSLHKGLRGDYMYSWCAYRVLSSKDIWMMHRELVLKKDSASVNCFISENGKEKKYGLIFFKKINK